MALSPLFVGSNFIELPEVDSTNTYLKDLISQKKLPEGTCVAAVAQTSGRGQAGNSWLSEPGKNITLSILLNPVFLDAPKQFYLSMAMALAVKDFCESQVDDEVKIKWPNDIFWNDNKLGGLLIENTISGSKIVSSVVGIGLNVNQVTFPEDSGRPVSLANVSGRSYILKELYQTLFAYIEKYYLQLRQQHFNFLDKAYMVSMYRYQQTHDFRKGKQLIRGEIAGVTKDGRLILQSGEKEYKFNFKEVEFIY